MILLDSYETPDNYIARLLSKMKIERLGAGAYAHVFQHPTMKDVAVKFLRWKDDDYIGFAKFAMQNKTNPWLPRIYSIHEVKMQHPVHKTESLRYLVFLEKLEPVQHSEIQNAVHDVLADIPLKIEDTWRREIKDTWRTYPESFVDLQRKHWRALLEYSKDDGIRQFAKFFLASKNHDLHDGNVMKRADGHLVFVDPVA